MEYRNGGSATHPGGHTRFAGVRRFVAGVVALAVLAAAVAAVAGSARAGDPVPDVELRVWQSVAEPLRLWVHSRPDEDSAWSRAELDLAMIEGGGWRAGGLTVPARGGRIELRVWQDPSELQTLHLSARRARGDWTDHGTQPLVLDRTSANGRYRYADLTVALARDAEAPPEPGGEPVTLCIPEGLGKDAVEARVWRSVAAPDDYWVHTRPTPTSGWTRRAVTPGPADAGGWRTFGVTADAGAADFELRVWRKDGAHHLSARVAGGTWLEYGTQPLELDRTSANGRYTYADAVVTLTLPGADPPLPGEEAASWTCPEATPTPTPAALPALGGFVGGGAGGGGGGGAPGGGGGAPPGGGSPGSQAPAADAGADQSANREARILINGNGSQAYSDVLWKHTGGTYDGTATFRDNNGVWFYFNVPADAEPGETIIWTLKVSNDGGQSDSDSMTITVTNENPYANAGPDQSAASGTVTLDGSGSDDPEDDTLTYAWAKTGGTCSETPTLTGANTASPSFTMPSACAADSTLIFTLTVTDAYSGSDTDTVTVAKNNKPVADAGSNQSVNRGEEASLNASATRDADDTNLSYAWAKTGGSYTGSISIPFADAEVTDFTVPTSAPINSTIEVTVTVSDGKPGGTDTATVTITALNFAPMAEAGSNANANRGSTVTLNGSGSSDPEGTTLVYSWAKTGGSCTQSVSLTNANTARPSFTVPTGCAVDGTLIFTLTVKDENGGSGAKSHTDTVTITAKNATPTVHAGADVNATAGAPVSLNAVAADPDDTTHTWHWTASPTSANTQFSSQTVANPTFTPFDTATINSTYTLTATATDDNSASGTDTLTVTVTNRPPTANAGADTSVNQNATATLSGSGSSDPDGDSLTYSWAKTGGTHTGAVSITNATSASASFTAPNLTSSDSKTLVFTLTVSDGKGGTATDTVTVTVQNVDPTVTLANRNVTNGTSYTLTATGNDPDGDNSKLTYGSWEVDNGSGNTGTADATITQAGVLAIPEDAAKNDTYTVRVTVTDEDGATARGTATMTVNNLRPSVTASADACKEPGQMAGAMLTRVTDSDRDMPTFTWAKTGGTYTGNVTLRQDKGGATSYYMPSDATDGQTIELTVTADDGNGGTDTAVVATQAKLSCPTGPSNPPQNVPAVITFNDEHLYQPAGGPQADGKWIGTKVRADATVTDLTGWYHTYAFSVEPGTYTNLSKITPAIDGTNFYFHWPTDSIVGDTVFVELTVLDVGSPTHLVEKSILISRSNAAPTANAGEDKYVMTTRDNSYVRTFTGSGSDPDPGQTLYYNWSKWGGSFTGDVTLENATTKGVTVHIPTCTGTAPNVFGDGDTIILRLAVSDDHSPVLGETFDYVTLTGSYRYGGGSDGSGSNEAPRLADYSHSVAKGSTLNLRGEQLVTDDVTTDANMTYEWAITASSSVLSLTNANTQNAVLAASAEAAVGTHTGALALKVTDESCGITEKKYDVQVTN